MPDEDSLFTKARHTPWNKGKLIGAKPPLRPNQVWSIRTRLLIERRARDLALFNLAIDSKLRGCDVVALRVGDVDRDRGEPRSSAPPTPPCVRLRTRRFEKLR